MALRFDENAHKQLAWTGMTPERINELLVAVCRRALGNRHGVDVDDAVQECWIAILKREFGKSFDCQRGPSANYLAGTAHRVCGKFVRSQKCDCVSLDEIYEPAATSYADSSESMAQAAEFRQAYGSAVDQLTPAERAAVPAIEERAEAGRISWDGGPPTAQHTRESWARRRLRRILGPFRPEERVTRHRPKRRRRVSGAAIG